MSRLTERDIARRLSEREDFEPPAGLLEKIKSEIPPSITVGKAIPAADRFRKETNLPRRQRWLIAASITTVLGAGLLAFQLSREMPSLEEAVSQESSREDQAKPAAPPAPVLEQEADAVSAFPPPPPPPPPPAAMRPEVKEELESLGYVGPSEPVQPVEVPQDLDIEYGIEGGVEGGVVGGVAGGVAGGIPGGIASDAPASAPPPPPPPPPPAPRAQRMKAEPEAEHPGVYAKSAGNNPFVETETDRLSTFGLDVDTGSYTVTRRSLADGVLPRPESVRVEEFVNFFDYGDAPPARGDFALKAEGAPSPYAPGSEYRLLRFNVKAREVRMDKRRPVVLTFVVDVSGSMNEANRLPLVKQSLALLLDQLRPGDRVGLVVYGAEARVLQEPTDDREAVRRAIDRLVSDGATNAEAGLTLAYDVAGRAFRMNAVNRIILCSDGVANVGHTGPQAILGRIGREARRGIELTTLGFGMGDYNDHLMEQLADKGDGRYAYVDDEKEARRVLVEELSGTLLTVAKNAKVQVELNPAVVESYRLLGYENRAIDDHRFRDETVDAGEVGAGHSVTALYEVRLRPGAPEDGLVATLHLRYRSPETAAIQETVKKLRRSDLAPSWEQASPALRLAGSVAEFAEILRKSPWAGGTGGLPEVLRQAQPAAKALPKSETTTEFLDLVRRAAAIGSSEER
ncbi:MAG TPA: von Willebrand factor type A domain-containing protein [Thermoanaerobaculia bacterium]|nr:von Willebrand factor type A domain-containing protein [Thermoanaerobaculia bacterium]